MLGGQAGGGWENWSQKKRFSVAFKAQYWALKMRMPLYTHCPDGHFAHISDLFNSCNIPIILAPFSR